jgi:hypothetical protein
MDEINPYATPGSVLHAEAAPARKRPLGYGLYKWCSLIYGALFVLVGFVAVIQEKLELSWIGLVLAIVVITPLLSYVLVAGKSRRLFYAWLPLHLLSLLVLVSFGIVRVQPGEAFKAGFTLFMIVANGMSWLSSLYFHWRLGKK